MGKVIIVAIMIIVMAAAAAVKSSDREILGTPDLNRTTIKAPDVE